MQQGKKLILILLCALTFVSALSGCAEKKTQEGTSLVLRASLCGCIGSLDPAMNTDEQAESVFLALYENLMRLEDGADTLAVVPGVAKEYEEVANGDGTVDYVFTLRSSARWSDGTRVKAHDFVYAWRRLADPATDSPNHEVLAMVKGYDDVRMTGDTSKLAVKEDGDTVFRVTLSAPCEYFISEVCTAVATMPLRSDLVQGDPDWARTNGLLCDGPYQVGAWIWEEYIQLRRNPSYYSAQTTGPDTLRFAFAASEAEMRELFETGQVDYAAASGEGETDATPLRRTVCVIYNHTSDAFYQVDVRKAFDLALDRAAIAAAAETPARPATGFVPPGVLDRADAEKDFRAVGGELCPTDAEDYAMRTLNAADALRTGGYWGGVGFPETACLCTAEDEPCAAAAVSMWNEKLGLSITVEAVSREEYDRRIAESEYTLALASFGVRYGDAMDCLAALSGLSGDNALHYLSTPFDLLIGVASTTRDPAARNAFLHDAEELMLDDAAVSPLCFAARGCLLREGFSGVRTDRRGNVYFNNVAYTAPVG